jgi:hypothetical protein
VTSSPVSDMGHSLLGSGGSCRPRSRNEDLFVMQTDL